MGNKIQANLYRLGITQDWTSRWFGDRKTMKINLISDAKIRRYLNKQLPKLGISSFGIERQPKLINVIINTSKAGIVIGKGGSGVELLKKNLKKIIGSGTELRITVEEVKKPNEDASIVAENIVGQVEKRIPFRRVLKQTITSVFESNSVKGIKVMLSGRLDGAEMSRSEYLTKGKIPLATLRANIDFSKKTAHTKYGTVGVKVWIYKGDILQGNKNTLR